MLEWSEKFCVLGSFWEAFGQEGLNACECWLGFGWFVEGPHNTPCKQGGPNHIFWGVCPLLKMASKSLCYQLPKIAENY